MKDPEIELKRRLHNLQTGHNLTYEEFCLYEIRNLYNADKISAKEFKTTIGIERNVKNKIMRKLQSVRSRFNADAVLMQFWYKYVPEF